MSKRNKYVRLFTIFMVCVVAVLPVQSYQSEELRFLDIITTEQYPLNPVDQKIARLGLKRTPFYRVGVASWYGDYFHGRTTANMEIYDKNLFTAAHKSLPLGTFLLITNLTNNKQVVVRVNDRGPYIPGREVDLSEAAAKAIGSHHKGITKIKYEILVSA